MISYTVKNKFYILGIGCTCKVRVDGLWCLVFCRCVRGVVPEHLKVDIVSLKLRKETFSVLIND